MIRRYLLPDSISRFGLGLAVVGSMFSPQAPQASFEWWVTAVQSHRPGEVDNPIRTVAVWSTAKLDTVSGELRGRLRGTSLTSFGIADIGSRSTFLKQAAFFHADLAMLHRTRDGYALPESHAGAQGATDGQSVRVSGGTYHWRLARAILNLVPEAKQDYEVRDFYRATSAWLQDWTEYSELRPHLQRALELFPNDAALLLYQATMHEAFAAPNIQMAAAISSGATSGGSIQRTMDGWETTGSESPRSSVASSVDEFRNAERFLRQALKSDPSLVEAQIRLGRVLAVQGRDTEAVRLLGEAVTKPLPPKLGYYAHLSSTKLSNSTPKASRRASCSASTRGNWAIETVRLPLFRRSAAARVLLPSWIRGVSTIASMYPPLRTS
jgi:hypothetical protein